MTSPRSCLSVALALGAFLVCSQLARGAARSVRVIIKNDTDRTLTFVSGKANHGIVTQKPPADHLGKHPEDRLDPASRDIGFLTTPFKRLGFGGWVDTGCEASAKGWPVRDAQHSTDGFWTIDVKLKEFTIQGHGVPPNRQRWVRIEVEPKTPAHAKAAARANQFISFHGHVLIDTHHGDELIEVHPFEAITLAQEPLTSGKDTCKQGFVWREAVANDHVCVSPQTRDQARQDNANSAARRQPGGGASGPDTCRQGFVWREATPADHVCVTPQVRAAAADDNRHAAQRRVQP